MQSIEAISTYHGLSAAYYAGRRSIENLLNCYCREIAEPENKIKAYSTEDSIENINNLSGKSHIHVAMPRINTDLLASVEQYSITGSYRFGEMVYYRRASGTRWMPLTWKTLAKLVIDDLSIKFGTPFNIDLFRQICESNTVSSAILEHHELMKADRYQINDFIGSEQSLIFGHPYHPAPKSRQGFSRRDVQDYSPELKVGFPLDYFEVAPEFVHEKTMLPTKASDLIKQQLNEKLPTTINSAQMIPVHPWQAKWLLKHPAVKTGIKEGSVRYHPAVGENYFPTSSLRTLYHPNNPYFYKFSLHVRITNCVRKNAYYELSSALKVGQILQDERKNFQHRFPYFTILQEPAFITLDLARYCDTAEQSTEIREGFAMILRENVTMHTEPRVTPMVSGALFEKIPNGEAPVLQLLRKMPESNIRTESALVETWLQSYAEYLIKPVLYAYITCGIVFEPHMQNIVVGIADGLPRQIFLRDFEGVKLVSDRFDPSKLKGTDPAVLKSLSYSDDLGWKRVTYCLFVNHLGEAIGRLSQGNTMLEMKLWKMIGDILQEYSKEFEHGSLGQTRIYELLSTSGLPAKSNLIGRFLKRRDRESSYQYVRNPFHQNQGIFNGA